MVRLQNKFLFYDGEKIKKDSEFITIELVNLENDGRKFFVFDKEVPRNGNKLIIPNKEDCNTFNVVCKDKNGRFLWKTNAVIISYEDTLSNVDITMEEIEKKLNKIREGFDAEGIRSEIKKVKDEVLKIGDMPTNEEMMGVVENFNILANSLTSKVSDIESIVKNYDKKIELFLSEYTKEVSEKMEGMKSKIDKMEVPDSPFDLDFGKHDVQSGYFVSFDGGAIRKYKFCNKMPFGVVLPDGKIRTKGYCVVRHDGVNISLGITVMGDENGVASKYSKGYPVVKIVDASHCGILI